MKVEEVAMCADIEVTADAHVEEIEAKFILNWTNLFRLAWISIHLKKCMRKERPQTKFFDGPALRHGFIDTEELENAKRRKSD